MIPLELAEVTALCAGTLEAAPGATAVTGVKVDSRLIEPGDLFVAVGAGQEFLADARARSAAATLVPDDPFTALAALGKAVRNRSSAKVVGITGSMGKTSTKDILAALCRPHAHAIAAHSSFNNEIGVPLTLCRLEEGTEIEVELDRGKAIVRAIELARPGDVVVIAGKGHEQGQEFRDRQIPFDDRDVARETLRRLGARA